MLRFILILTIVISLYSVISAPALAADEVNGSISGKVINGTAGGDGIGDLEVVLKTYTRDAELDSLTTRTNAAGEFTFDNVAASPDYGYQTVITYQGVEYSSDLLVFSAGELSKSVEVAVYETTSSDEAVKVMSSHTVIYIEQDHLLVKDYYLFVNDSDRTVAVPAGAVGTGTLAFALPDGAANLTASFGLMDCCIVTSEKGFIDIMPVIPGSREVSYSYTLGLNSASYLFSQKMNYPTANFDLLIQDAGIKASSEQLAIGEPFDIKGVRFIHFSGKDLAAGTAAAVKLSGLQKSANQPVGLWLAIGLAGAVICFIAYTQIRRKKQKQVAVPEGSLERKKQQLMTALAELDDSFENGSITRENYTEQRASVKTKLLKLMQEHKREGLANDSSYS